MEPLQVLKQAFLNSDAQFCIFSQQVQEEYGSWSKYLKVNFSVDNHIVFLFKHNANEHQIKHIIDSDPALLWHNNNNTIFNLLKCLHSSYEMGEEQRIPVAGKIIDILAQKEPGLFWIKDNKNLTVLDYLIMKDVFRFDISKIDSKELEIATNLYMEENIFKKENILTKILDCYQDKPHSSSAKEALEYKIKFLINCNFFKFSENQKYAYEMERTDNYWQNAMYEQFDKLRNYVNLQLKLDLTHGTKKTIRVKV